MPLLLSFCNKEVLPLVNQLGTNPGPSDFKFGILPSIFFKLPVVISIFSCFLTLTSLRKSCNHFVSLWSADWLHVLPLIKNQNFTLRSFHCAKYQIQIVIVSVIFEVRDFFPLSMWNNYSLKVPHFEKSLFCNGKMSICGNKTNTIFVRYSNSAFKIIYEAL